ncbi:MAG: hypothetical protein WCS70_08375 [Verrucomicrobiota bacterium]
MRRTALRLTAIVLLIAGGWLVGRNAIGRWLGQICLRRVTGIDRPVESVSFGWTHGRFEVRDVTCTNLHRGGSIITAVVPRLVVDYQPASLLRRQLHVYSARCEIQTLEITNVNQPPNRVSTNHTRAVSSSVKVDTVQIKLDGSLSFSSASSSVRRITGKMETTFQDVNDFEALRALLLPGKSN